MLSERIDKIEGKRVLIAPLNWGLGHATRSSAIIYQLLKSGKEVIIGSDGIVADYYKTEFPGIKQITIPGLTVKYSAGNSQTGAMLRQVPKFLYQIWREHKKTAEIIEKNNIDTIISDNRFGMWNRKCKSIYITHQLMIKMPKHLHWAEKIMKCFHGWFYNKYNEIWVPDNAGKENLSGDLSHKYKSPKKCHFIGILSRFNYNNKVLSSLENCPPFDETIIISGPEPHRSMMENRAKNNDIEKDENIENKLIICGKPDPDTDYRQSSKIEKTGENIYATNHLSTPMMAHILTHSKKITCRSGYSTIMDLYSLGILQNKDVRITLIPTPGQTEQEYLALHIKKNFDNDKGNRIQIIELT